MAGCEGTWAGECGAGGPTTTRLSAATGGVEGSEDPKPKKDQKEDEADGLGVGRRRTRREAWLGTTSLEPSKMGTGMGMAPGGRPPLPESDLSTPENAGNLILPAMMDSLCSSLTSSGFLRPKAVLEALGKGPCVLLLLVEVSPSEFVILSSFLCSASMVSL